MFPWKTIIHLDRASKTPIFLQISNAIIKEVTGGRLKAGQRLPGSRALSNLISVNRKTVSIAYEELTAQGWIEVMPSKGTFVAADLPLVSYRALSKSPDPLPYPVSTHYQVEPWSLQNPFRHQRTELAIDDGSPDTRLAPLDILWRNCRGLTRGPLKNRLLSYGDLQGDVQFREVLAQYLASTRGLNCRKENIMITRGSIMALYVVLHQLIGPGDKVIVGKSNYPAANSIIESCGGSIIQVDVDQWGISTDQVEEVCNKCPPRAIYITPHHHYPTTVTLSAERRLKLLELSHKYRFAVLEDDYDYDFHYTSGPILPLASYDHMGAVVYMGSFSKLLAPGIRVGYLVAPENLISMLCHTRRHIDRQGDFVLERALSQLIIDGDLKRHLKKSLRTYHQRRDHFCRLLLELCDEFVNFCIPEGGMAVWTEFVPGIDIGKLQQDLEKRRMSLDVNPQIIKTHRATRLGFASLNQNEAEKALEILAEVMNGQLASKLY